MLDLNHVRSFVALAEEMHFGRAAARLNLTQSPLSRQMQMLEHRLGAVLLERTTRAVSLTPAGRAFLPEARGLLLAAEAAERAARRVASGEAGTVRIGFTAASAFDALPRLVAEFRRRIPGLDLALSEMVTAEQIDALVERRLDLALARPDSAFGSADIPVEQESLLREGLLLAVPTGHKLAAARRATLSDLHEQPFVTWSTGGGRYFLDLLDIAFREARVRPRITQRVNQTHTMLSLVGAGLGLALVPQSARRMRMQGVVLRPVAIPDASRPELILAWRRDDDQPALAALRTIARGVFGNMRVDGG